MARDRRGFPALLLLLVFAAIPARAGGDANLLLGQKWLTDDKLEAANVDTQFEYGVAVTLDFDWPVDLAFDLTRSSADDTLDLGAGYALDTDVDTLEFDAGVRKLWRERLQPFVGGGLSWIRLAAEQVEQVPAGAGGTTPVSVVDDSGSSIGFWLNAGLLYRVGTHFNVGLDLRYSDASVDLQPVGADDSVNLDTGGTQVGLLLGYHW